MEKYLTLADCSIVKGHGDEELKETLTDITLRREMIHLEPSAMKFIVMGDGTVENGTGVLVPPDIYNRTLDTTRIYKRVQLTDNFLSLGDAVVKEATDVGVLMILKDPKTGEEKQYPISAEALRDLQNRVGLNGRGTEFKSTTLMELLCELAVNKYDKIVYKGSGCFEKIPNGGCQKEQYRKKKGTASDKKFGFTAVLLKDRNNPELKKVFALPSARYSYIPQTNILQIISAMKCQKEGMKLDLELGEPNVQDWEVTNFYTSVDIEFPEKSQEYTNTYGLKNEVVPCLRATTSDTGDSSFRFAEYCSLKSGGKTDVILRIPKAAGEKAYVLSRHFGGTDMENLTNKIQSGLFKTFREVPEKLNALVFMGSAKTRETLEIAFKAMRLQKHAGVVISQDLEAKIVDAFVTTMPPVQDIFTTVYTVLSAIGNRAFPVYEDEEGNELKSSLQLSENQWDELGYNALLAVFPLDEYQGVEIKTKAAV